MKVLVTGGAGYIGSVVAEQLLVNQHEVEVLDNLSTGHMASVISGVKWHEADLAAADQILDSSFDAVIHLAAKSLVGESMQHPERYWHGNVVASLKLIEAARRARVPRLIFSSTAAVYGNPISETISEDHPTAPINPYGATKLAIDHMLTSEAAAHGLAAVSLRYFNVGGASGPLREQHEPETHLIPNLLKVASGELENAQLFGTDYPTHDGTAIRDYIHVKDLAHAHLLAMDWVQPGVHEIFNLGTSVGSSVREVIDTVARVTGRAIPVIESPRRPGDPAVLVSSGDKAERILKWSPTHSLESIVSDAWTALPDR